LGEHQEEESHTCSLSRYFSQAVGQFPFLPAVGVPDEHKTKFHSEEFSTCGIMSALKMFEVLSQALVAHTCNPSYSGGRDQEDQGSKPVQANNLRPYLEKTHHKKGLVEWLK
jgi:hypothetical protein